MVVCRRWSGLADLVRAGVFFVLFGASQLCCPASSCGARHDRGLMPEHVAREDPTAVGGWRNREAYKMERNQTAGRSAIWLRPEQPWDCWCLRPFRRRITRNDGPGDRWSRSGASSTFLYVFDTLHFEASSATRRRNPASQLRVIKARHMLPPLSRMMGKRRGGICPWRRRGG